MRNLSVLSIFILLILSSSCQTRIEDNRRILITGKLQDENGEAISNINIISGDEFTQLGTGLSDAQGDFSLTSLSLANTVNVGNEEFEPIRIDEININTQVSDDGLGLTVFNDNYSSINIVNRDFFNGVSIDLGVITLQELAQLEINFIKQEYVGQELEAVVEYKGSSCQIDLAEAIAVEQIGCQINDLSLNATLFAQNNERSINISCLLNETVSIEVFDNNGNLIFDQEFTINQNNASIDVEL